LAKLDIHDKYAAQFAKGNVEVLPLGKRGFEHFSKHN
jgi:F-type H+-transporting ATPase subunit gamma